MTVKLLTYLHAHWRELAVLFVAAGASALLWVCVLMLRAPRQVMELFEDREESVEQVVRND